MTEVKKETIVTSQLLEETLRLKKNIRENMMSGETDILRGIVFFEEIIKEVNPMFLDIENIDKIKSYAVFLLKEKEEKMQRSSNYVHYGLDRCFLLMDSYSRRAKKHILGK